jgi:hypothetical protein
VDFDTADCDSDDQQQQQQQQTNNTIEILNKSANDHANKSISDPTSKKFTIKDSMSAKKSTNEAESIKKSEESPASGEKSAAKTVAAANDNGKDDKSKEKTRELKSEM